MRGILVALTVATLVALMTAYGEHPPYQPMGDVELAALAIAGACTLLSLRGALKEMQRARSALARVELHLFERGLDGQIPLAGDEFDGIAHRLNALTHGHVGEDATKTEYAPEPVDDASKPSPETEGFTLDEARSRALAEEPEDAYVARIFEEYVAAKRSLGEDVGALDAATFAKGLQANADRQRRKLGAVRVRFVVRIDNGAARLEPVALT